MHSCECGDIHDLPGATLVEDEPGEDVAEAAEAVSDAAVEVARINADRDIEVARIEARSLGRAVDDERDVEIARLNAELEALRTAAPPVEVAEPEPEPEPVVELVAEPVEEAAEGPEPDTGHAERPKRKASVWGYYH